MRIEAVIADCAASSYLIRPATGREQRRRTQRASRRRRCRSRRATQIDGVTVAALHGHAAVEDGGLGGGENGLRRVRNHVREIRRHRQCELPDAAPVSRSAQLLHAAIVEQADRRYRHVRQISRHTRSRCRAHLRPDCARCRTDKDADIGSGVDLRRSDRRVHQQRIDGSVGQPSASPIGPTAAGIGCFEDVGDTESHDAHIRGLSIRDRLVDGYRGDRVILRIDASSYIRHERCGRIGGGPNLTADEAPVRSSTLTRGIDDGRETGRLGSSC